MKFLRHAAAFFALLLAGPSAAQATVAIFIGREVQVVHQATDGLGNTSNGVYRTTSRVYFIFEVESGRSVEICSLGKAFKVRAEHNLVRITTPRVSYVKVNQPFTLESFFSDASRTNYAKGASVESRTWEGLRTMTVSAPEVDPATLLPYYFPRTLTARHDFSDYDTTGDRMEHHVRRVNSVNLMVAQTKTSNAAQDTFDAAVQRLKNALANDLHFTEVPNYNDYLDR
jgi:hypothetical protein